MTMLFFKFYQGLYDLAAKRGPGIKKYKQKLTAGVKESGVIKQGETLFCPSYKKYFYCDKNTGEGYFFRYKPVTDNGKYPIVIYHHGNGLNRAGKNYMQMSEFSKLKKKLNKTKCHQVVIHLDVSCEYNRAEHSRALDGFVAYIQKTYNNVDFDRIYLVGTSHGGYASIYEILRKHEKYAAAVISMGYTYNDFFKLPDEFKTNEFVRELTEVDYATISQIPVFISWAKDDDPFITNSNDLLLKKIRANNGDIKYRIYDKGGHTIYSDFFKNGDWDEWMFSKSRKASALSEAKPCDE